MITPVHAKKRQRGDVEDIDEAMDIDDDASSDVKDVVIQAVSIIWYIPLAIESQSTITQDSNDDDTNPENQSRSTEKSRAKPGPKRKPKKSKLVIKEEIESGDDKGSPGSTMVDETQVTTIGYLQIKIKLFTNATSSSS